MADDYDFLSDEPSSEEQRQAMVAALRKQQADAQSLQGLGLVTSLGENPVLQRFAPMASSQGENQALRAQQGLQSLASLRHQARQEDMEQRRMDAQEAYQRGELDYRNRSLTQERWKPMQLKDGSMVEVDTRSGNMRPLTQAPVPGASGGAGALNSKQVQAGLEAFQKELSSSGRGNINESRQKRLDAAERLEALILNGKQIQNLNPQQVREASTALANLISQGSVSEHQIEELTPESYASKWAALKQKVLNQPQGAEAQAFLQNMLETAGRETGVTRKQMRETMLGYIPRRWELRKYVQPTFDAMLKQHGFDAADFDESGLLRQTAPTAGGGDARLHHFKAQLQPGERLVMNAAGKAKALAPGEAVPAGFQEVP